MTQLEHANLVVREIGPTLEFLLAALPQWSVRGRGQNSWSGKTRNWVHVGTDSDYITLNDGGVGAARDLAGFAPGLAHLGLVVDDLDGVIERLRHKGFDVDIYGQPHPFRKTAYFIDPAGFQFEFIQYLSSKPEERNMYGGETGRLIHNTDKDEAVMNTADAEQLVKNLYDAVDGKDIAFLEKVLSSTIRFRIGNNPDITSKAAVLEANRQFFASIQSMQHTLDNIWVCNDNLICHGSVHYVRLDGSTHNATFATVLRVADNLIEDYVVYADLSGL